MIKAEINREKEFSFLSMDGDLEVLVSDICLIVNLVFSAISKTDEDAAKLYQESIQKLVNDPNQNIFKALPDSVYADQDMVD